MVVDIINDEPISPAQLYAIGVCLFLLALDGFDVLAIAFAAPGISTEWQLGESVLGWVVVMELIGRATAGARCSIWVQPVPPSPYL